MDDDDDDDDLAPPVVKRPPVVGLLVDVDVVVVLTAELVSGLLGLGVDDSDE